MAGQFLGGSDTIAAVDTQAWLRDRNPGLATRWFPVLTADGAVADSIPFQVSGKEPDPLPSPDGRHILIWSFSGMAPTGQGLYVIDRSGRLTDTLPLLPGFFGGTGLQWSASGDGVLMLLPADSVNGDLWTQLRFPVSAQGRVRQPPDTVVSRLRLPGQPSWVSALSSPSRSGDHAIGLMIQTHTLSTLERPSVMAPPARRAELMPCSTGMGMVRCCYPFAPMT